MRMTITRTRVLGSAIIGAMLAHALPAAASTKSWSQVPGGGRAREIAAGDGTSPWIIGTTESGSTTDYYIYYYVGGTTHWKEASGVGQQIGAMYAPAASGDGYWNYPLVIDHNKHIFFGTPGGNDILSTSGATVDYAEAGSSSAGTAITGAGLFRSDEYTNGPVFVISTTAVTGGYDVFETNSPGPSGTWSSPSWSNLGGPGTRVSVSQDLSAITGDHSAWMVDSNNKIYYYDTTTFAWKKTTTGTATDVGAGSDNTGTNCGPSGNSACSEATWIVGTNAYLYHWNGSGWTEDTSAGPSGTASRVSVGWNGSVYVIDTSNVIWVYQ